MVTINEIEDKILELKKELKTIQGTETEVYARIVGYYRSVNNWNKGKKEEFNIRKRYTLKNDVVITDLIQKESTLVNSNEVASLKYFYRTSCPNCPPVKQAISELNLDIEMINVDLKEGIEQAIEYRITAAPTVIFLDKDGNEIDRAFNAKSINDIFCTSNAI